MNDKQCMVIKTDDNYVHVVTREGDFQKLNIELFDSLPQQGDLITMPGSPARNPRQLWLHAALGMAAVVLIVLVVYPLLVPSHTITAYLEVEVNPVVRLSLDAQNQIREVKAKDDMGSVLLSELQLTGLGATEATEVLIDKAVHEGFLNDSQENVVLITLIQKDLQYDSTDITDIRQTAQDTLESKNITGIIAASSTDQDTSRQAREEGLTTGRKMLLKRLEQLDISIPPKTMREVPLAELPQATGLPPHAFYGTDEDTKSQFPQQERREPKTDDHRAPDKNIPVEPGPLTDNLQEHSPGQGDSHESERQQAPDPDHQRPNPPIPDKRRGR